MTALYTQTLSTYDAATEVLFPEWSLEPVDFVITDADRAVIEQSRQDFAAGRSYTLEDSNARTAAFLRNLYSY
jgi:hypothetical protein